MNQRHDITWLLSQNSSSTLITAWGIFLITIIIWWRLRVRVFPHLYRLTWETVTTFDDAIMLTLCKLWWWFYAVSWIWFASTILILPSFLVVLCQILFLVVVVGQLWQWVVRVVLQVIQEQRFWWKHTHNFTLLAITVKVIVWTMIGLLILTNLGIKVTPLLASLGVIGIAVSFALKSILEDLFASISIYLDKPFRIGDYIAMGEHGGSVEHVGIKTTRIRTILWEELVIANRKLTESVIHNYGKIKERTITHKIVISFTTSSTLQTALPNLIKQSMEFTNLIDFKRCHLIEIGSYGLIYKRRYTLRTSEYDTHLQIQEKVLMNVLEKIEQEWITIEKQYMI